MNADRTEPIQPLREGARLTSGEADLRGWSVISAGGSRLGEVHDLFVPGQRRAEAEPVGKA